MSRLELDAGNTFIKWRLLDGEQIVQRGRWPTGRFEPAMLADVDARPAQVWLASVAGKDVNRVMREAVSARWNMDLRQAFTQATCAGVINSYRDPARMGVDRWLAMLAAWHRASGPCCVVDCGSAITVDLLDAEGVHRGGYILPGLRLMQISLLGRTAEVRVEEALEVEAVMPGRSTEEGVSHGARFMLMALAEQLRLGLPGESGPVRTLVTGGDAEALTAFLPDAVLCPDLVLDGLQWAWG
ncbi:type III pantothenate kinase [Marinobacterium sp. AK62]|uniref:Type III pantothenate kinase n=1 Tax=Marinobacterium alkalitolerans TaxID=1542925 RepID=A0ABS3ZE98_9GAMM|nr:type III pantothenate kinase [Marinobacterium alkalitolerans]MBP0050030.1 type III pantothenate kinase [Marinobacterium alkalitolerans]